MRKMDLLKMTKFGLISLSFSFSVIAYTMSSEITEEMLLSVLEELCKNDTSSVQRAGDYLLNLMNNPSNIMLFFLMINKPYPNTVPICYSFYHVVSTTLRIIF